MICRTLKIVISFWSKTEGENVKVMGERIRIIALKDRDSVFIYSNYAKHSQ